MPGFREIRTSQSRNQLRTWYYVEYQYWLTIQVMILIYYDAKVRFHMIMLISHCSLNDYCTMFMDISFLLSHKRIDYASSSSLSQFESFFVSNVVRFDSLPIISWLLLRLLQQCVHGKLHGSNGGRWNHLSAYIYNLYMYIYVEHISPPPLCAGPTRVKSI